MLRHAVFATSLLVAADAFAEPVARPARLGLCVACHGEDGFALTAGTPHIAGQDETYLVAALGQYRSGERKSAQMRAASGALSNNDIAALSRWYAAQPRCRAQECASR